MKMRQRAAGTEFIGFPPHGDPRAREQGHNDGFGNCAGSVTSVAVDPEPDTPS